MVRHTRRKKGGSYRTPIRPIDNIHLRILNAHGSISPEYYYIVPDNVYLVLPNECGLSTSEAHVVTQPIFETPEEGMRTFRERFVQDGARTAEGAPFTVYEPGDILPVHVFEFYPFLSPYAFLREAIHYAKFGYVGLFEPGSLQHLPFLHDPRVVAGLGPKDNSYQLDWYNPPPYAFGTHPLSLQNYCIAVMEYLKTKGSAYKKLLDRYSDVVIYKLTRLECVRMLKTLLPVIPENSMAPTILTTGNYHYSLYDIVEHCVAQRTDANPMYILINACRSLQESVLGLNEELTVLTTSKPSLSLVRAISSSVHTDDGTAAVNMKTINMLRRKKGLRSYDHSVIKYDQLRTVLGETRSLYTPETDTEYAGLMSKVDGLLGILHAYAPTAFDAVFATKYMVEHIDRITTETNAALRRTSEAANASRRAADKHMLATYKGTKKKLQMNKKYAKTPAEKGEINAQIRNVTAKIKEMTGEEP